MSAPATVHILCIGNEILRGHTLNSNLAFIGRQLDAIGIEAARELCVPDTPDVIRRAVQEELAHADVLVTIGGLGPTSDDVTRGAVAGALGVAQHLDESVRAAIDAFLKRRGVCVPEAAVRTQAMVPEGADVLLNRNGTAPGLWCEHQGRVVIMLPGPPREFCPMVLDAVMPRLRARLRVRHIARDLCICGIGESTAAARLEAALDASANVRLAYCAQPGKLDVRLSAAPEHASELEQAVAAARAELGAHALPESCNSPAAAVAALLSERGWTLAAAESCTGGGIAAAVTDIAGASEVFAGAAVTYSNDWKTGLLGVRERTLADYGAVSEQTAAEMLDGLIERYAVEAGIVVTGIAGPSGGTPEKPVGLVFIGTAAKERRSVRRYVFPGNREAVRQRTVAAALNQLRLQLLQTPEE